MNLKESKSLKSAKLFNTSEQIPVLVYSKGKDKNGIAVDDDKWKEYQKKAGL